MSIKTQGTNLFIIDPAATGGPAVLKIPCAVSIDGVGAQREQIEDTCLESLTKTFKPGLPTPEALSVTLNFDPSSEEHGRIHEMFVDGTIFDAAIGWSDGVAVPDIATDGNFDLPTSRSFLVMNEAYVANFPFTFNLNAVVTSNVQIQQSDFPRLYRKI